MAKRARDSALTLSADTELRNDESGVDGGGESCVLLQQNGAGEMVRGDVGGGGDGEVLEMEEEEQKEEDEEEEEEDSRSGGDANGGAQVETSASVSLKGLSAGAVKCAETKKCKVKRRIPSAGEDRHTRHSGKKPEEGQSKRRRSPSPLTGKNVSGMNSEGTRRLQMTGGLPCRKTGRTIPAASGSSASDQMQSEEVASIQHSSTSAVARQLPHRDAAATASLNRPKTSEQTIKRPLEGTRSELKEAPAARRTHASDRKKMTRRLLVW